MKQVARVPVRWPRKLRGFAVRLRGYRPGSAELQMVLMARVSTWLECEGLAVGDLTTVRVELRCF